MPTDVRSPMIVSSTQGETVTGGMSNFAVTGRNASSPHNTSGGLHARAAAMNGTATLPGSRGETLKNSMMTAYNAFGDNRASIGHAEGDAVFKAQAHMSHAGRQQAASALQGTNPHFSPADLNAIAHAAGTTNLHAYAAFEASALAWNDVAHHGEIIGPSSVPGQAFRDTSPAGHNPRAWVQDLDANGAVRSSTTWATCQNCQTQIMPHLRKHN